MGKTLTGPRIIFRLNSIKVAHASNVSYNENIAAEDINVLDRLNPEEIAETGYTLDFSCNAFVTEDGTLKDLGIMPRFKDILKAGVLTGEILDNQSDLPVLIAGGVKCLGRSGTVDARGVLQETWNFRGIVDNS